HALTLSRDISILLGKGDGTFNAQIMFQAGSGPRGLGVGDFNSDGRQDVAVAGTRSDEVSILLNQAPCPVRSVRIDVKPGDCNNRIQPIPKGALPLAILGSELFDAAEVVPATILLSGAGVKVVGKGGKLLCRSEFVDGDDFRDLLCQIDGEQLVLGPGQEVLRLQGMTASGEPIRGEDIVNSEEN
ncbi:MAG: VCBS repeat-containing protein, partial [Planctomycetes bacterium]|nr:VCBS repeat-containing protein [Planctomycetota bacterium]